MVITTYGKTQIALRIGSNIDSPVAFGIGTGSGTASVNNLVLVTEADKQDFSLVNLSGARVLTFQGDWNSVEMSGIQLSEWGIFSQSAATTGSTWSREAFTPITFDGTNELQIEETWEVY
jgi:hypothetical protein